MPAIKSLIRGDDPDKFVEMLIKSKVDFDMYCSNYAMKLIVDNQIFNFTKHEQSRQTFAAFSKLKSDLQDKPKPDIAPEDVTYFLHDFREPMYVERVCNIDLKSAYANILFKDNLISGKTHKYLSKLAKKDRLSSVGMLASLKKVYEFRAGEPGDMREERSEFAPFFFYAVKRTFEIMQELKKICNSNYLFTWVDGIYFLPDSNTENICRLYLKSINFPCSIDFLDSFEVSFMERSIKLSFEKDKKKKRFDLPMNDSVFMQSMSKALLLNNNKNKKK